MRLLGFNAGRIRPQLIDGEVVRTAYVKEPVAEPWVITPTGAGGDEVAAHSDHLYAFDRASYDHWAEELGVPRETWTDGWFAENLTIDTLDQSRLRVGDTLRVGTAVLVVTGPRVPCWKLTWRLGQPKTFMRRFRLSGRSGAYFGVLEPGVVRPGDRFTPIAREDGAPTVAALSRLCDSSTRITPEERGLIDRALASEHLSPTARGALTLKVANLERDASAAAGGWPGWRRFEIDDVVAETTEATSYLLRPADGGDLPGFRAGQHVVVRLTEPGEEPVVRTWSLSSYARDPERYRITVSRRPGGRGGAALARAPAGELTVELRAPAGEFRLDRGTFRPVVLVAAGIGITPMIAMIQAHLDRDGHPAVVAAVRGAGPRPDRLPRLPRRPVRPARRPPPALLPLAGAVRRRAAGGRGDRPPRPDQRRAGRGRPARQLPPDGGRPGRHPLVRERRLRLRLRRVHRVGARRPDRGRRQPRPRPRRGLRRGRRAGPADSPDGRDGAVRLPRPGGDLGRRE